MGKINLFIVLWLLLGIKTSHVAYGQPGENAGQTKVPTRMTTNEQHYMYRPVNGGIEIVNGELRFNRALYSSVERPYRLVSLAGDRPDFMLMELLGKSSLFKLANLMVGFSGGPWLSEIEPVTARYELGVQKYQVVQGANTIFLDAVRAQKFDGLLLRMSSTNAVSGPLVFALGGRGTGSFETDSDAAGFNPGECRGTTLAFEDNVLTLSGEDGRPPVYAASPVPLTFKAGDPAVAMTGPDALLASQFNNTNAVGVLSAEWPQSGELFFILTADAPDSPGVANFLAHPETVFDQAIMDNREIASVIQVNTPDPYLNSTLPAVLLGYNATWNDPVFCHGAVSWHSQYAGWRNTYGGTVIGWHDRVQSHMKAFYGVQHDDGRIPSLLEKDEIYNMGEVLVDQALYDWEWTGDLEPLRNGGFDAIARHLAWGETYMKTPEGLYENFLNAWNTDYKWSNGGGGTIASVYYWRANKSMADIAKRLHRDPSVFQQRTKEIADAIKTYLWSERIGGYGEYRDRFGHKMLHESPDLSSIYTSIDAGFTNPFESYRMLRFALHRFGLVDGLPRDGKLIYSSEWLPNHYSTRGLYTHEIIHTLLTMYRIGQSEVAEPFRRAIDGSFFSGPGPGSTGLRLQPDGQYDRPNDFTDPLSMYLRNVVEGLFGIQMDIPNEKIVVQPSFPLLWDHASINSPAASYEYTFDGRLETLMINTSRPLESEIRLRARYASIQSVKVNERDVKYNVEPGIGCAWIVINAPVSKQTMQVEIVYGAVELPVVESMATGVPGERVVFTANQGLFTEIHSDARGLPNTFISDDGRQFWVQLPEKSGLYTFFVQVERNDVSFWAPVEVDVQAVAENVPVFDSVLTPVPVELDGFRNQRLAVLHNNTYGPRVKEFDWVLESGFRITEGTRTVKSNGRSWWEGHGRDLTKSADTHLLEQAGGRFVSDNGIPFAIPPTGDDAVFTSLYDNFPDSVEIPVKMNGRKICFLVAASISIAQSRMENARITVILGDGTRRILSLRDPENIDDWLGSGNGTPYVQFVQAQPLGKQTHAVLLEIDFGEEKDIQSVILETRTCETMVGLLGMTVMQ